MASFGLIIFFLSTFVINFSLITAQSTFVTHSCSGENYIANSTFDSNLNVLLSSLSSNGNANSINRNGFYYSTAGRNTDTVYGALQCRGDVTFQVCRTCVDIATQDIRKEDKCPNSKEAIIWYDECMLRYSNRSFFAITQESPTLYLWSVDNVENPAQFNLILGNLFDEIISAAVSRPLNNTLFATGERNVTPFQRVYGLVQCTSDIPPTGITSCYRCLRSAIREIPGCCDGKQGGRVIRPSCNVRFETFPFYQSTNTTSTKGKGKSSTKIVLYITIPVVIVAFISTIVIWFLCFQRKKIPKKFDRTIILGQRKHIKTSDCFSKVADRGIMQTSDVHLEGDSSSSSKYYKHNEERNGVDVPFVDFETILTVTDNFSNSNKLGQGGFGPVYKGTFKGGQEMAVKRLSRSSGQGLEEFRNEVSLIAKLQHRNLVKLLGYCVKEEEKILLYEYMPNKSLDIFIFDRALCLLINWEKRLDIILGIARGILYLHQDSRLRIIHRDLKTSNILLDEEMNPKISDFGLARICGETQTDGCTNRVVGTYGYMAPEYALDGFFSVKSDVYSFGVLLLEIISGKKNSGFYGSEGSSSFIGYAWRLWNENKVLDFIDDSLYEACNAGEALKCIQVGLLCVQEDANDRPTMSSVVFMLGSEATSIPTPKQPAVVFRRYLSSTTTSSSRPESYLRNEITDEGR